MKMFYTNNNNTVQYKLVVDPPEAVYWSTFKLKPEHIKCEDESLIEEIYEDIINSENPDKKYRGKWWG